MGGEHAGSISKNGGNGLKKKKCIIFGVGNTGGTAYEVLKKEYEIIGFADNNSKKWGELFCQKPIYSPNELHIFKNIEVIIASMYYASIYSQLKTDGIENISIFCYTGDVLIRNYDGEYRLCQLPDMPLFFGCRVDMKKAEEIERDFAGNYCSRKDNRENIINIKTNGRKNVLFCAYSFPPMGGGGVQRSLKFVKYLRNFGYEPIVLTVGKNDGSNVEDKTLLDEVQVDINIVRVDNDILLPELMLKEEQQEIFNLYMGIVQSENWINEYRCVLQKTYQKLIPDNMIIWVNRCLKEIEQKIDLKDFKIVYTTGNPFSTFFLGYYIKKKYGIKWVMDYRDPWMSNDYYNKNYHRSITKNDEKLQQQLESRLVSFCDYVIGAADFMSDFAEKYNIYQGKFMEITNGYDEEDFKGIKINEFKNEKFTLCYNGRLYGSRNPVYLLRALNCLIEEKKIDSSKIQWILNGGIAAYHKSLLDQEDLYGIVRYNGSLSHRDSITSAINTDLLVLFGFEGTGTEIGYCGKLFEYLRMGKPIVSFSSKGGVLDRVFQKTHSGKNFDYKDEVGIREYILSVYSAWENETKFLNPAENEIKKYDREYLTYRLSKVFDQLL